MTSVLMNLDFIVSFNDEEESLVRTVTKKYKFDYQVLIVDDAKSMRKFIKNQIIPSQVVNPDNYDISLKKYSDLCNVGYFVFLENYEDTKNLLNKADPYMFKNYTWFIKTSNIQENFGI